MAALELKYFTARPKFIRAVQWTGDNYAEVHNFTGYRTCRTEQMVHIGPVKDAEFIDNSIQIWNVLEECWVKCPLNHWVIEGISGEFYPCDPEVMEKSYKEVTEDEFRRGSGKAV